MIERFHTVCDRCGGRGQEYLAHTIACHECGDDVCEKCAIEHDPEPPGRALCKRCVADSAPEQSEQAKERT